MIEKNLLSLQLLVESLVDSHEQLAIENNELHKKIEIMQQKNSLLLNKKEEAFKKLKGILAQIREETL